MILVADSGSTKTEWRLIDKQKNLRSFHSIGFNPFFMDKETMAEKMKEAFGQGFLFGEVSKIFFYGSGCSNDEKKSIVKSALSAIFSDAEIKVEHDVLAAAIALCKDKPGIACILGTGSNVCYYNGKNIEKDGISLGYILGDEGSGSYLGKTIVKKYLYKELPEELENLFAQEFKITKEEVTDKVYKQALPNRYLASFSTFYSTAKSHPYIQDLLMNCLNDFFIHHILKLEESKNVPVCFTGSIAFHFSNELQQLCNKYKLQLGTILKNPIDGLVEFHS